jgi:hypothetical protein
MFIGSCQRNGKERPESMVAVLNNSAGQNARDPKLAARTLRAAAAWQIDTTNEKFVKHSTENLACPVTGIVTADGGP